MGKWSKKALEAAVREIERRGIKELPALAKRIEELRKRGEVK